MHMLHGRETINNLNRILYYQNNAIIVFLYYMLHQGPPIKQCLYVQHVFFIKLCRLKFGKKHQSVKNEV